MPVLSLELAESEVQKWMDAKKVRASIRESNKDNIDGLVEGFKDGLLTLHDDNIIKQTLIHPIEGLKTIEYKSRLTAQDKSKHLSKAGNDVHAQITGLLAALSGQNSGMLMKLDTDDVAVIRSLTSFFF